MARDKTSTLVAEPPIDPGSAGMVAPPTSAAAAAAMDPAGLIDEAAREKQAHLTALSVSAELAAQAGALGMSAEAFAAVLRASPQLAAQMIAQQAKAQRGADSGSSGFSGLDGAQSTARFRADTLAGRLQGQTPAQLAAFERGAIPESRRKLWTIMYPPPDADGYVHGPVEVPKVDLGWYAQFAGYTLLPQGPPLADKIAASPIVCGILTNHGTVCDRRFLSEQAKDEHQRVKHPGELQARERQRTEDRWQVEREQREQEIALQREQIALQREQIAALRRRQEMEHGEEAAD